MAAKEAKPNDVDTSESQLQPWLPLISPGLKTFWADYLFSLPANQPAPNVSDWLALLHISATAPDQLPQYLPQLLNLPQSNASLPNDWEMLTDLLELTFEAARAEADKLDGDDWQNLLLLQNRILKAAAQLSSAERLRPTSDVLTRRALYLQTITDISTTFNHFDHPSRILDEIVAVIQTNFGYEFVNLYLLNSSRQILTLQNAAWTNTQPKADDYVKIKVKEGIVGRVAATGQGMLVNDVSLDASFAPHPALPQVKAKLAMPLMANKNLVGVLDIASSRVNNFSEEDQQIVQALANYIAVIIENARLQKAQQRYTREQMLIHESIVTLGTRQDMDAVLKHLSRKLVETVDAGACVICRIDEKSSSITALAEYVVRLPGNPKHTWRTLNKPLHISKDPVGRQLLRSARPIINRANSNNKPSIWQTAVPSARPNARWNTLLALPFETNTQITGLIEIYDKSPSRVFSSEDIKICRILATQTAIAMEQSRLLDETLSRLSEVSMLYTMAEKIASSLDLEDVLNTIVTSLREVIGCRACCIFLVDESEENLEIKAADGLKPHWRKMAKLKLGEGAAGVAAAEGRTVYLPDTHKDPNFIFFDKDVHSLLVVPLVAQGKVIGTINVDDSLPNAFDQTQERLLAIAAAQAGITIENARLFTKISAEQQQMQAIIQHMADGLLLINSKGVIITCNATLAMMLGMHPGQIVGQNIHMQNLPPNLASITADITNRARTGVLAKEVAIEAPRQRALQVFSTTVVDSQKQPVGEVRLVHDVTRERELEQLKDDFFSTISHELRTPLFSIQGFAQLMLEEEELDPETQKEFLGTIQRQAIQLSEMVNNLLDISKLDAGKLVLEKKPVIVADLINQTILKLQGFAHQQQVRLSSNLSPFIPEIMGDNLRLEQVLTNLIGNAIKFSAADQQVLISAALDENSVLVQVTDNGIGIPAEDLDQIFSRYYQAQNKSERSAMGTGLGLHISKKIIEGHQGRIWAESVAGQGSTFCFTLPVSGAG